MKTNSRLFGVAIFALFVCLSLVSAFSVAPTSLDFSNSDNSNDITITTDASETISLSSLSLSLGEEIVTFDYVSSITVDGSEIVAINMNNVNWENVDFKQTAAGSITLDNGVDTPTSVEVTVSKDEFCDYNNPGDLEVKIKNIENNGMGEDDKWYPLDEIEVTVDVENDGNDDIEDISLEWGLYSEEDDEWVIEIDEEDEFNLNDGDEETYTITFDLDDDLEVDLDELNDGKYTFYVRATGTTEDTEIMSCISDSETADVVIDDDFVTLSDVKVIGETFCGSTVQITADIWNIGTDDQDDVSVDIINKDLDIDENVLIGNIDPFDDKSLNFELTIPKNIDEKPYYIELRILDKNFDIYESDDKESVVSVKIDISGNCELIPQASVYASLESGGKAGKEMKIKATVTNTGSETETFKVSIGDYSSWSELSSISPESITLSKGQAGDVIVTLNIDSDASEKENFNILLEGSDGGILTQPVEVSIEKGFFSRIAGDNAYLWGIAILNVILVLVIIIIAVRVARR